MLRLSRTSTGAIAWSVLLSSQKFRVTEGIAKKLRPIPVFRLLALVRLARYEYSEGVEALDAQFAPARRQATKR